MWLDDDSSLFCVLFRGWLMLVCLCVGAALPGLADDFSYVTVTGCTMLVIGPQLFSQIVKRIGQHLVDHLKAKLEHR